MTEYREIQNIPAMNKLDVRNMRHNVGPTRSCRLDKASSGWMIALGVKIVRDAIWSPYNLIIKSAITIAMYSQ